MAEIPKASVSVKVDVDLTPGKIEAQQLAKEVNKKLTSLNRAVKSSSKIPVDIDVDLEQLQKKLNQAQSKVTKEIDKALKQLGSSLNDNGKNNLTTLVKQRLSEAADVVDSQGKIIGTKLREVLRQVAKETGNSTGLAPQGKSRLKVFLDLEGKSIDEAVKRLNQLSPQYKKAVTDLVNQGQEALSSAGINKVGERLEQFNKKIRDQRAETLRQVQKAGEALSSYERKIALSKTAFEETTKPGSTLADSTRVKALNSYTGALLQYIAALELAKREGKDLGITELELDGRLSKLRDTLREVSPALFELTQGLRNATKDTPANYKQVVQLLGQIESLQLKVDRTKFRAGNRTDGTEAALSALKKERDATRELVDVKAQLAQLTGTTKYAQEIEALNSRIATVDKEIDRTAKLIEQRKEQLALDRRVERENRKANAEQVKASDPQVKLTEAKTNVINAQRAVQNAKELKAAVESANVSGRERIRVLQQQLHEEEKLQQALFHLLNVERQLGQETAETNKAIKGQQKVIGDLSNTIGRLESTYVQLARSIQLFFRYAVLYGALYKAADSVRSLLTNIIDLQAALTSIKAVAGATTSQMRGIAGAVQEVAETTSFSVTEVAQAGQTLVQAGVGVKEFGTVLKATANLAAATGATLAESADVQTTFMEVFENTRPEDIADRLRNAVNISKLSIGDLKTIANFLLETSDSFNISMDNVLAAASTLRNAGLKASTIGTGLRQGLLELFKPDKKTLEGLQRQYALIGQNLSKESIAAMFAGFEGAKDPLLAVINELEKLGVAGVNENQFTRVLDIRAENAIKTLVRNKDAYIQNTQAIKESGTATKGAQVQLEAFKNSWQNFTETIVNAGFSALEGAIKYMTRITNAMGSAVESIKERINELKAETGSTGVGSSVSAGITGFVVGLLRNLSLGKSFVTAFVAATIATTATAFTKATQAVEFFTSAVQAIVLGLAANRLFGGLFGAGKVVASKASPTGPAGGSAVGRAGRKVITGLGGATTAEAAVAVEAAGAAGLIAALGTKLKSIVSAVKNVGRSLVASTGWLGLIVTALSLVAEYAYDYFVSSKDIEQQKASGLQAQKAAIDKAKDDLQARKTAIEAEQANVRSFGSTLDVARKAIASISSPEQRKAITEILEKAAKGTTAVGSEALQKVAEEIQKVTGKVVKPADLSDDIARVNNAIKEAEGARSVYFNAVQQAYSALESNQNDTQAKETVAAFESLDEDTKRLIQGRITTIADADKLLVARAKNSDLQKNVDGLLKDLDSKQLDKEFERAMVSYKALLDGGLNLSSASYTSLRTQLLEAVDNGQVELVTRIIRATNNLFSEKEIATAQSNRAAALIKPFQDALSSVQQQVKAPEKSVPSAKDFEQVFAKQQAEVQASNAKIKQQREASEIVIKGKTEQLSLFIEDTLRLQKEGSLTEQQLLDRKKTLVTMQEQLAKDQDNLARLGKEQVGTATDLEAAQRANLASELAVAEAKERLKVLHNTKVHSTQEEVKLIQEIFELEKAQLQAEKEVLKTTLANEIEKQKLFDTKGVSAEDLLRTLSGQAGKKLLADSKELADAYKALGEVVSKERDLRSSATAELEDALRKELDAKADTVKSELTKQQSKTQSIESELQTATNRLQSARDKLAQAYEKQAELEAFFEQSIREVTGQQLTTSDINNTIAQASEIGSADLAKSAVDDIKSLLGAGKIGKGEAVSLIEQARYAALEAQTQEIIRDRQAVSLLDETVHSLSADLLINKDTIIDLNEQLKGLNDRLDNLKKFAESQLTDTGAKKDSNVVQVETTGTQVNSVQGYKGGGLIQGSGTPTSDSVPILASRNEYMQPAAAVDLYGVDFMEKIRNLQVNPQAATAIANPVQTQLAKPDRTTTDALQPVTIQVGDLNLKALAQPERVKSFEAKVRVQSLKTGRSST